MRLPSLGLAIIHATLYIMSPTCVLFQHAHCHWPLRLLQSEHKSRNIISASSLCLSSWVNLGVNYSLGMHGKQIMFVYPFREERQIGTMVGAIQLHCYGYLMKDELDTS